MSNNKIFKNNQVNVGMPFQIRSPLLYQPPVKNNIMNLKIDCDETEESNTVDYEAIRQEIVNKAKVEADLIIKEALLEAKDIISNATNDVEILKNEALNQAREEGYSEGINKAEQEYVQLLAEAQNIKEQAGIDYKTILDSIESDAVSTILDIAKKVISQELKCKENILLLVKDAFEKCSKDRKAVLKLCQEDYEYVNEHKDELIAMLQRSDEVEIKKDLSLNEGGCVIDTPYGSIDASAVAKFEKIENDFESILEENLS